MKDKGVFFAIKEWEKAEKKCPSFLHAPSADRNAAMQINAFLPNIKGMQSGTTQLWHSNRLFCNTFFAPHFVSCKMYVFSDIFCYRRLEKKCLSDAEKQN